MKYRPEIDGLRAFAVLPVILFHAGFDLFSGGFIGVDVFFVISGYLITCIILEQTKAGRFSLVEFYERRARRILPALFFIIICCIPFAWLWMLPSQLKDFSQSLLSIGLFLSNLFFWHESGYFESASEEKPLLHTWSLAVEGQYYLIFPIIFLLVCRFGKPRLLFSFSCLSIASFLFSEWASRNFADLNFYFLGGRAWELLVGGICAVLVSKEYTTKLHSSIPLIGLLAIFCSVFIYDKTVPFPSHYTLLPVMGTAAVILFVGDSTVLRVILCNRYIVGIGLISYSAYLWHQPIFSFARIRSLNEPSGAMYIFLSFLSLGFSYFTWRYIEKVFRRKEHIDSKYFIKYSTIGLAILVCTGFLGHVKEGFPGRIDVKLQAKIEEATKRNPNFTSCHFFPDFPVHPVPECISRSKSGSIDIMMLGDSHLESISLAMQAHLRENDVGFYSVSYSSCIALPGFYLVDSDSNHRCHEFNLSMLDFARKEGIKTLMLVSRFPLYLRGDRYNNGDGGQESGKPSHVDLIEFQGEASYWNDPERLNRVADRIELQLEILSEAFNVIVFDPVPEPGWDIVNYYAKSERFNYFDAKGEHSYEGYLARVKEVLYIYDSVENLTRYSPAKIFCNEITGKCSTFDDTGLYYRDDNHLSIYGAKLVADDFFQASEIVTLFGKK